MTNEIPRLDRNLALELMRVTEAGALAAARAIGKNDPALANQYAVESVRRTLAGLPVDGVIVVGEGEERSKDRIYLGERLGDAEEPRMDIAVDPVDGAELVAAGAPGAICTVALSPRNTLFRTHVSYMERIVTSSAAAGAIDITAPIEDNLRAISRELGKSLSDLKVIMLERTRHDDLMRRIQDLGAEIKLIPDGDVTAAVLAALPEENGFDVLLGVGGAPQASLMACAVLCLGGGMQARLWTTPDGDDSIDGGSAQNDVLTASDLCRGGRDVYMALTGITSGELLNGVRYRLPYATTQSLVMRSHTGTARRVESTHDLQRLESAIGIAYGPTEGSAIPS